MTKDINLYDSIMLDICHEHASINTRYTEYPDEKKQWTIRDMVSEVQYCLDLWNDEGSIYWQDAHSGCYGDPEESKRWNQNWHREKRRFERFIKHYKEEALKTECHEGHCSRFD